MKKYNNLSQSTKGRLVYIRSTDLEQKNWKRLLWSIPDEMLYFLSIGEKVIIHDITSNHRGGKVKRIFCPVVTDVLNHLYFKDKPLKNNLKFHFNKCLEILSNDISLLRKFVVWKKKIKQKIEIIGEDTIVKKEPNPLF